MLQERPSVTGKQNKRRSTTFASFHIHIDFASSPQHHYTTVHPSFCSHASQPTQSEPRIARTIRQCIRHSYSHAPESTVETANRKNNTMHPLPTTSWLGLGLMALATLLVQTITDTPLARTELAIIGVATLTPILCCAGALIHFLNLVPECGMRSAAWGVIAMCVAVGFQLRAAEPPEVWAGYLVSSSWFAYVGMAAGVVVHAGDPCAVGPEGLYYRVSHCDGACSSDRAGRG